MNRAIMRDTIRDKIMAIPKTDNCCTRMGWDEYMIETGGYDLHVSIKPDADLDGRFQAFCHDEQEIIAINGWLIESIEREG